MLSHVGSDCLKNMLVVCLGNVNKKKRDTHSPHSTAPSLMAVSSTPCDWWLCAQGAPDYQTGTHYGRTHLTRMWQHKDEKKENTTHCETGHAMLLRPCFAIETIRKTKKKNPPSLFNQRKISTTTCKVVFIILPI